MLNFEKHLDDHIMPNLTRETCKLLNDNSREFDRITWSNNESNIDEGFSKLAKKYCEIAFNDIESNEDINLSVKIPDLILEFHINDQKYPRKIELKSTKSKVTLGSTIMCLNRNIWTIICKRDQDSNSYEIRYGRYYLGMDISSHEKFQDRSPRPSLNFYNYQKFNEKPILEKDSISSTFWKSYADSAITRILDPKNHSWQDDLVKEIIKIVLKNPEKFKHI